MMSYHALHESAAWIDISDRGRIKAGGEDRLHFVHAMSTNDIENLSPGEGIQTLFLNGQGHIQADVRVFVGEDHLLLDCDCRRRETLPLHLNKFIVMDDVSLEDVGSSVAAIAVEGPRAEEVAAGVTEGVLPPPGMLRHVTHGAVGIARSSLTGGPGLWFFLPPEEKDSWIPALGSRRRRPRRRASLANGSRRERDPARRCGLSRQNHSATGRPPRCGFRHQGLLSWSGNRGTGAFTRQSASKVGEIRGGFRATSAPGFSDFLRRKGSWTIDQSRIFANNGKSAGLRLVAKRGAGRRNFDCGRA